jgi:hypothetical protein
MVEKSGKISISDLIKKLSVLGVRVTLPDILAGLEVDDFTINKQQPSLSFTCQSDGYGRFALVGSKANEQWSVALGVEADLNLEFPSIPLLSDALGAPKLKAVSVFMAGKTLPSKELLASQPIFGDGLTPGISLRAQLELGDKTVDATTQLEDAPGDDQRDAPGTPEPVRSVRWIKVDKDFGPVHFEKIGFGFNAEKQVSITPAFTVKLSALTVELDGLSVSFPMKSPSRLSANLDGLSLSYASPALTISGEFLHQASDSGDMYAGDALIKAAAFELSALGAYFKPSTGAPSIFIYLIYEGELGGPPFFFIKGLAGGFGFNYRLKIPDIDGVKSFPFVAQATGTNIFGSSPAPADALDKLKDFVTPQVGEDWLAAGVRFSTFEILDSFALLTAQVGTTFEIALLGLSTLQMPPDDPNPIAQAQLALDADFSDETGLLKVEGKLTSESFILSSACKLTGGFAFYTWFSGDHEGDFVITLGGYNDRYNKPSHYPSEPRIGFRWQISDELHLEGGIYFALTPAAVMAGGKLSATFESGGLRAWFDAYADFLLLWKPFQYEIDLGLDIGVSYTVHVWFVHVTISVHLGVNASLYGPPFGGEATIHVGPFNVTIHFGHSSPPALPPLTWSAFSSSFLPAATVRAAISGGKRKGPTSGYAGSIVDPASLELRLDTAIPIKTGKFNEQPFTAQSFATAPFAAPNSSSWTTSFGVGPCAVPAGRFESDCTITLQYSTEVGGPKRDCGATDFVLATLVTSSPKTLWGASRVLGDTSWLNEQSLIAQTLTGFTITTGKKPAGHQIGPYPVATLLVHKDIHKFQWASPSRPSTDSFDQSQAMATLASTIGDARVSQQRTSLLEALKLAGLPITDTRPDVSQLSQHAANILLAPPALRLLGEERR